jgi:hypothetical protein
MALCPGKNAEPANTAISAENRARAFAHTGDALGSEKLERIYEYNLMGATTRVIVPPGLG